MAQQAKTHPVQTARMPAFYKEFHCLAQRCQDNCCMGWKIHFDKKDYLRLRRLEAPAELRERLSKGVRRIRGGAADDKMYGQFDLDGNGGRCPFLDQEGLCGIQRACGHDALPDVCTGYPRRSTYSAAAKEYALSPSCEGVLELLWDLPDGVTFIEEPLPKVEYRTANVGLEGSLVRHYAALRSVMLGILQNRALPLTERMLYLGIAIQRLQKEDWDHLDPDKWGQQTASLLDTDVMKQTLERITGNRNLYIMQNLKVLWAVFKSKREEWLTEVLEALSVEQRIALVPSEEEEGQRKAHLRMNFSPESYQEALDQFEEAFSGREYFFENLMVAAALYMDFPSLIDRESLWKSYVSLCNLYSFYRFSMILGCKGQGTKERLFHMIVKVSRVTLHNRDRFRGFQEELFQHDSSTLAHMAILLKG